MRITKTGIASIQDLGRHGFRNMGIVQGGVMDPLAAELGNMLVANTDPLAQVELAAGSFSASFSNTQLIALTGTGYKASLNGLDLPFWQPALTMPGDSLHIIPEKGGICYLSVHGGLRVPPILGSRSTNLVAGFGGFEGRLLKPGDDIPLAIMPDPMANRIIRFLSSKEMNNRPRLAPSAIPDYSRQEIRFMPGHEYDSFSLNSRRALEEELFELTAMSNRMGFRLKGEPIFLDTQQELISTAVVPGTMQVSPDGQILVLMADAQTAGGYPRIGQVIAADLPLLAQKTAGSQLRFSSVPVEVAETTWLHRENQLRSLIKDYNLHFS